MYIVIVVSNVCNCSFDHFYNGFLKFLTDNSNTHIILMLASGY